MMRWLLLLGMLAVAPIKAQTSTPFPLPDQPIATVFDALWGIDQLVWLDNETLLFEIRSIDDNHREHFDGYQYDLAAETLTALAESPFYFAPTEERLQYFQMLPPNALGGGSFRSPFAPTTIIYGSSLRVACGLECGGGLIMLGQDTTDYSPGTYFPLRFTAETGIESVLWGRANQAAVLCIALNYGGGFWLAYQLLADASLSQGIAPIGSTDQVYALSDDDRRVLYTQWSPDTGDTLVLWEADLPTATHPYLSGEERQSFPGDHYVGANFIADDPDHILTLDKAGIAKIDVNSGKRIVLNPAISADWVQLGVFSPDNRHLAVIKQTNLDGNLYVIDTGAAN